jgi:hypothetical protein
MINAAPASSTCGASPLAAKWTARRQQRHVDEPVERRVEAEQRGDAMVARDHAVDQVEDAAGEDQQPALRSAAKAAAASSETSAPTSVSRFGLTLVEQEGGGMEPAVHAVSNIRLDHRSSSRPAATAPRVAQRPQLAGVGLRKSPASSSRGAILSETSSSASRRRASSSRPIQRGAGSGAGRDETAASPSGPSALRFVTGAKNLAN